MIFWTLDTSDIPGASPAPMLCERHALDEINAVAPIFGLPIFETMNEAYIILETLAATFHSDGSGFGLASHDTGSCVACQEELEAAFNDDAQESA